jgi:hypothetical protein
MSASWMVPFSEASHLRASGKPNSIHSRTVRWHLENHSNRARHLKHGTFRSMGIYTGYNLRPERSDSFPSFFASLSHA